MTRSGIVEAKDRVAKSPGKQKRILVVAHQTAPTLQLTEIVGARARQGSCSFTLLVPRLTDTDDPDREAEQTLQAALPRLKEATGDEVRGIIGPDDPYVAAEEAMSKDNFDEIIVSTLPERWSRWLRRDLPRRLEDFGVPVTVVTGSSDFSSISWP